VVSAYDLGHVGVCVVDGRTGPAPAGAPTAKKNADPGDAEQPGSVQGRAEPWVPLSVPEIRRLFWRLVLATRQTVGQILDWSAWRRWHQGVAQYYHYKRRTVP